MLLLVQDTDLQLILQDTDLMEEIDAKGTPHSPTLRPNVVSSALVLFSSAPESPLPVAMDPPAPRHMHYCLSFLRKKDSKKKMTAKGGAAGAETILEESLRLRGQVCG